MRSKINRRRKIFKMVPWLKLALPLVAIFFFTIGISGKFRYYSGENAIKVPTTPMSRQPEVPERVFRGNLAGKKLVALTFDDGPSPLTTPRLLDILKEKGAVVTFFELGGKVENYPEITRRAMREGHEIASHTMWHQNLVTVSRSAAEIDINEARRVFREVIGEEPKLTRLPYGNSNDFLKDIVATPLIYWSVDTRDWEALNAEKVADNAVFRARDGAIILMHDIYDSTIDAVPNIIDRLRGDGYEFVTVSELAEIRGEKLQNGVTYIDFEP